MTRAADTWQPPVREEFAQLSAYGAPHLDVPVVLNVNENPFPPPAAVIDDIIASVAEAAGTLNRYPDRDAWDVRRELATYLGYGLTPENIWVGNGSNEVMLHLLQAFGGPGRSMMVFPPTYSMYPEYARDTHTRLIEVARDENFGIEPARASAAISESEPNLVVIASPNNPTGTAVDAALLEAVLAAAPGLVVVDEAYAEFARPTSVRALDWQARYPNLVVTRTMSKAFALAGARVGYLAAHPAVVRALQVVRLPYHLSGVTQAVALAALRHEAALLAEVDLLRQERDGMVGWLRSCGFDVADSDANFAMFGRFDDARGVWQGLLDRGVLIREVGPPGWLRVSIGTPAENGAFRDALEQVMAADVSAVEHRSGSAQRGR